MRTITYDQWIEEFNPIMVNNIPVQFDYEQMCLLVRASVINPNGLWTLNTETNIISNCAHNGTIAYYILTETAEDIYVKTK